MTFDGLTQPAGPYSPPKKQALAQVKRIRASYAFKDRLQLADLLEYLVELHYANRYREPFTREKPRPTGSQISNEFYNHRLERYKEDKPKSPAIAGKRLVRRLREQLDEFYGDHPREAVHGPLSIEISDERGCGYRPVFKPLHLRITRGRNVSKKTIRENEPINTSQPQMSASNRDLDELADILNSRLAFLNDPQFGHEISRYFDFAASHGIYCHDLRTNFVFREVDPQHFPSSRQIQALAQTCFEISIREAVDRVCAPEGLRFAVFRHPASLAHHFTKPTVDFAWQIDLPNDAAFDGKISEIFRVDLVEVDGISVVSEPSAPADQRIKVLSDDNEQFLFEIDTSKIAMRGPLRKLKYAFHTLKSKDYRYVAYGTRVLTRGMTIKVDFAPETGIQSVVVQPSFSGDESPKPSEFEDREISISGWLLPRSGATFSFRYDKTYRK